MQRVREIAEGKTSWMREGDSSDGKAGRGKEARKVGDREEGETDGEQGITQTKGVVNLNS